MKKIVFLFIFASFLGYGQQTVIADLSTPNATLYTHIYFLLPENYDLEKAATTVKGKNRAEAQFIAKRIKEIYDGNGLILDFSKIPVDPNYVDSLDVGAGTLKHNANRYAPFPVRLPEVYIEKYNNKWYYSQETIDNLEKIYSKTFPLEFTWFNKKFPEFFTVTVNDVLIWKPVALLITLIISVLLFFILEPVMFFILRLLQRIFFKNISDSKTMSVLHELAKPIVFIVIIRFIQKVIPSLQMVKFNALFLTGLKIAETIFWIFVVLKLLKTILNFYHEHNPEKKTKLDKQLAPILNKVLQGIVILIGFLHILTVFGVDPTTVLAGASIGGVAVAFAAQDSVKNLIGTMVIFLDKPFQLDDWVQFAGVEGSVEKVGLRSTQIRAADTTLFQVPNSKISEADINNKGLRVFRRYTTELGIRYDTPPDLIETFVDGIKEIIALHPSTRSQSYNVSFISFGASSLNIMVNVYFKGLDWGQEQESKHILHLGIVRLAAALGVEFAFPSTTMMIEQFPGQESLAPNYMKDKAKIENEVKKIMDAFDKKDHDMDPNASTLPGG
ncbi:MAG: mechanosensitive ion channel family protein [Flavobacteriaceae bacterium]|nr:MAG: mechanosensitive ion channel family protein [Flavobacteriaceae bacterium]